MIFGNTKHRSTSPDKYLRRRNVFLATKNKSKNIRQKRMELRKIRSLAKEMTYGDPSSSSESDVKNKEPKLIDIASTSSSLSSAQPLHDDVVSLSYGKISVIGRRREMEDAVAVELGFLKKRGKKYDFFGVYDGHGGCGVADSCREKMHKILREILGEESGEVVIDWEKVMGEGFEKMDDEVNKSGEDLATTGSTAVVAVVGEDEIVVANCGDSRAVLYRGGAAVQLSDDHKPDRPDELERIEVSGGKVINWNGQRVLGVLATSRSIGDHYLKPFVITEPEVKVMNRIGSEEFLILASDGLWDVVTNDVACHVVRGYLDGQMGRSSSRAAGVLDIINETTNDGRASKAAAVLAELAMARGSRDNISVVVVELKRIYRGTC